MQVMDRDTLKTLAAANGLVIPDERLELVLREYQSLMQALRDLDALAVPREMEPSTLFTLIPPAVFPDRR
jgi:hypothetical protein